MINFIFLAAFLSIEIAKVAIIVQFGDGIGLQIIRMGIFISGTILFWGLIKYQTNDKYSLDDKLTRILPIVP